MSTPELSAGDPQRAELMELRERIALLERPESSGMSRLLRYLPVLAFGNILFAAPAMLISIVVAYFAFEQADATKKMQIGSVWPNVSYDFSNISEDGKREISMLVANRGVGPARIAAMEVSYRGKTYTDIRSLMKACCVDEGGKVGVIVENINGEVIAPGEETDFVRLTPELSGEDTYTRFDELRSALRVRLCYCSVFDDCWVEDSRAPAPEPVKACPAGWNQFGMPPSTPSKSAGP